MRTKREWYPGATYHIMQRGVRRNDIFSNKTDYEVFIAMLEQCADKADCRFHAFCLMTNHYHLLVETGEAPIWKLMKDLSHHYAMYYNDTQSYQGHLFEGRYKSCLVEDDHYFLQVSRYIHLNPVKAGMVAKPEEYAWSSYRTLIATDRDRLTETERTLSYFKKTGTRGYMQFVEDLGHKYEVEENEIRQKMGEDELWLPW